MCNWFLVGNMMERDCLEVSSTGKMITLMCVLKELRKYLWNECIWLRQVQVVGYCEPGNEPSDPIHCGEISDLTRNCQIIRKKFSQWIWPVPESESPSEKCSELGGWEPTDLTSMSGGVQWCKI
jgi:hypothetical protein